MTESTYEKPFLTVEEQLNRLEERGMELSNREAARSALRRLGYYRLSGYWHHYRLTEGSGGRRLSQFDPGTTFDGVLELYAFDEQLRGALLDAIAQVEVALRFELGHRLGRHGSFAHLDEAHFDPGFTKLRDRTCNKPGCGGACQWEESDHRGWIDRQKHTESVSTEAFAAHFREHYGEPLPIWVATEVMSFGRLTRLLDGLDSTERELLAAEWDVLDSEGRGDPSALSNWMEHLRQVRNICAHHARIWNRNINAIIAVPAGLPELHHLVAEASQEADGIPPSVRRVYGTFAILTHLLAVLDAPQHHRELLRVLLTDFLAAHPSADANMGFPEAWGQQPIAADHYRRDQQRATRAALLRQTAMLGSSDAAHLLNVVPEEKQRRSKLNYYRKNGAVLGVLWSARYAYPEFQFDKITGDVPGLVLLANRRLLDGGNADDETQWQALGWWLTPQHELLAGRTPAEAIRSGTLTDDLLDQLLPPRDDE